MIAVSAASTYFFVVASWVSVGSAKLVILVALALLFLANTFAKLGATEVPALLANKA